jgi:hypothetical protein
MDRFWLIPAKPSQGEDKLDARGRQTQLRHRACAPLLRCGFANARAATTRLQSWHFMNPLVGISSRLVNKGSRFDDCVVKGMRKLPERSSFLVTMVVVVVVTVVQNNEKGLSSPFSILCPKPSKRVAPVLAVVAYVNNGTDTLMRLDSGAL